MLASGARPSPAPPGRRRLRRSPARQRRGPATQAVEQYRLRSNGMTCAGARPHGAVSPSRSLHVGSLTSRLQHRRAPARTCFSPLDGILGKARGKPHFELLFEAAPYFSTQHYTWNGPQTAIDASRDHLELAIEATAGCARAAFGERAADLVRVGARVRIGRTTLSGVLRRCRRPPITAHPYHWTPSATVADSRVSIGRCASTRHLLLVPTTPRPVRRRFRPRPSLAASTGSGTFPRARSRSRRW